MWARLRDGVVPSPRSSNRAGSIERLNNSDSGDIPTLYLYGKATQVSIFATTAEVSSLLPNAQLHGLVGQRHLAFAFDPPPFAETVLEFTAAHDH